MISTRTKVILHRARNGLHRCLDKNGFSPGADTMLSCRQVTRLLSEARDWRPGLSEKMSLALHLAMCKGATNYRAQVFFLRDACRRYMADFREGRG